MSKTYRDGLVDALKIARDYAGWKTMQGKVLVGDSYRRTLALVDAAEYISARISELIVSDEREPLFPLRSEVLICYNDGAKHALKAGKKYWAYHNIKEHWVFDAKTFTAVCRVGELREDEPASQFPLQSEVFFSSTGTKETIRVMAEENEYMYFRFDDVVYITESGNPCCNEDQLREDEKSPDNQSGAGEER